MEGYPIAGPEEAVVEQGLDVGDQRKEGEDKEGKGVAFEIRARQRLSWRDAICSEMSPNRNTTTPSWMSRAEPMGILSNRTTFQIP